MNTQHYQSIGRTKTDFYLPVAQFTNGGWTRTATFSSTLYRSNT